MWIFVFIGLLLLLLVLWLIYRKKIFSQFQNLGIPGPTPNLLFGNLLDLVFKSPLDCHDEWLKKYGNVVGYYFGTTPTVLISDVEVLKNIQVSEFHKFMNRPGRSCVRCSADDRSNKNVNREDGSAPRRTEGFSQNLLTLRSKRWKEIRSIITPSFTPSKLKLMSPIMNGAIDSLVKNVEKHSIKNESFDIYKMYQGLTMDVIGRTAFGIQTDVQNNPQDPFLQTARQLFAGGDLRHPLVVLAGSFNSLDSIWRIVNNIRLRFMNKGPNPVKEITSAVKNVIATRRGNKEARRLDLLQLMLDAEVDESANITTEDLTAKEDNNETRKDLSSAEKTRRMTDADVLDNSVLFFLAGYETTSTALAFITHFLVHYPEVQEKVRQEVKYLLQSEEKLDYLSVNQLQYLDQVIHESLRLYPPIYLFVNREVGEDVLFGNIHLPKGMAVQIPTYYLQRDPHLWGDDAHLFKPERFSPDNKSEVSPLAFQVFGGGPRNCVGMRFAMMETKLTLARLLSLYNLEKCSETEKEDITLRIKTAAIIPKNGVWLKAVPLRKRNENSKIE